MYEKLTKNELIGKVNKYKTMLKEMMADKDHEKGTAEWLRIEIMKMNKELSKR